MKLVIDIKNEPKKNDLLIFNGSEWEPISKAKILDGVVADLSVLKKDVADFKQSVNNKLKEHHEVLQLLSKGGK